MILTRGRVAVFVTVVLLLAVSVFVARWLVVDTVERNKIERLLDAQARGDAASMAEEIRGCDPACRTSLDVLASRLRGPGDVEIVRYDSGTSHAVGDETKPTRVVWRRGDRIPVVQCVRVRRTGTVLTGMSVTLLDLSGPIGLEASC